MLDREGLLIKVHGGAMANNSGYRTVDDDAAVRKGLNRDEKMEIARYAAGLIEAGDIVYPDAGTTTELMIDFITQNEVTFVTNAFSHAKRLLGKGLKIYILGEEFKPVTEAIVGEEAMVKRRSMQKTKERYVLSDHTKFSQISSVTFADLDSAGIITYKIVDTAFKGYKNIREVGK